MSQSKIVALENIPALDGAKYTTYLHRPLVRQKWQPLYENRMMSDAGTAYDELQTAIREAQSWADNPNFWIDGIAVVRSDGLIVAWTAGVEILTLRDMLEQVAR